MIGEVLPEQALPAGEGRLEHRVSGAKGVEGGTVLMTSQHHGWS